MAAANFDRYDLNPATGDNVREDFSNAIYNIDPTATPFMTGCAKGSAKNTLFEWQTDDLHAVNPANAAIDGADAGTDESEASVRVRNTAQISTKVIRVSGRSDAVDKAGRRAELAYQLSKSAKSLKRDMESIITSPTQGAVAGSGVLASETAGLNAWVQSNRVAMDGTAGDDTQATPMGAAGPGDVVLAGTPAALTETALRNVIREIYDAGGDAGTIMVSPTNKQNISQYLFTSSARVATLFRDTAGSGTGQATATGAVDIYVSDFGALKIVPNRFLGHSGSAADDEHVYVLDMSMWEVCYLRSFRTLKLARTGDAENRELLVDYGLKSRNEAASGVVDTVLGSAAMIP